jgi:hypothetical protein
MANELNIYQGLPLTLQFISANLATGAGTVDMTLSEQLGTGFLVPTGYTFHPLCLCVTFVGTLDADATVIGKVIDNGTELTNGPVATINQAESDTHDTGVARLGADPIAAGHVVGVSLTKDADYDTTATIDWDAILTGVLLPA